MKLTEMEREIITACIKNERNDGNGSQKGFQSRNKQEVWRNYVKTSLGKLHKEVNLKGEIAEMYEKAFATDLSLKAKENKILAFKNIEEVIEYTLSDSRVLSLKNIFNGFNEDKEMKISKVSNVKVETLVDFKPLFDRVFQVYGSVVENMQFIHRSNGKYTERTLKVIFNHNNFKLWSLEFPFIDKDCFFISNNNMYAFMYTIENLKEIIAGNEKELKLMHPYTWLSQQVVKAFTEDGEVILYSEEIFNNIINNSRNENVYTLQRKLSSILKNSKNNPWDKREDTPIVWFDKLSSSIAKFSFTRNVLISSCYEDLVKLGLVEGLDLLTGSTSTPAKRVKPAMSWDIVRHGSTLVLERVRNSSSIIEDYAGLMKCSFPAFVKTSAKRDNSCTIKDTVDFIEPQKYQRKFIIKK